MQRFTEKVGIITGGASRLGLAAAHRLAEEGAKLDLVDLKEDSLKQSAAE